MYAKKPFAAMVMSTAVQPEYSPKLGCPTGRHVLFGTLQEMMDPQETRSLQTGGTAQAHSMPCYTSQLLSHEACTKQVRRHTLHSGKVALFSLCIIV
jgi:hypothetical protein